MYENFIKQESPFSEPKFKEAPVAPSSDKIDLSMLRDAKDAVVDFVVKMLPVSDNNGSGCVLKEEISVSFDTTISVIPIDFYGEKLTFNFSNNLKVHSSGLLESDVANYFRSISKFPKETFALWNEIEVVSERFGLNEWGKFLLLQKISEYCFQNINDRVLFCFYMLRNEGLYKVKVARGSVSNALVLMMAIDNTKEVYEYGYFVFLEQDVNIKYYLVYGAGREEKSVYTYKQNTQDAKLLQVKLDFDDVLSIGACDKIRDLKVNKLNETISVPFNSSNIAYLNDVPQTVFPIYFVTALPLKTQEVLDSHFGKLKDEYSIKEAIEVLLNFVQTSFDYKTDDDQFGREKYFYPEEAIAYPYCDCEDRSALFGWLVRTYLDLPIIGLQYPGHVATAVCLGEDVDVDGDIFIYAGKKYYVCDPTYIGASVGMSMPEFKTVTPKVIKLKKKVNF